MTTQTFVVIYAFSHVSRQTHFFNYPNPRPPYLPYQTHLERSVSPVVSFSIEELHFFGHIRTKFNEVYLEKKILPLYKVTQ